MRLAVRDLVDGLKHWQLWSALGWRDVRQKYRRSTLGPFWLTLSMGMMIGGLAYLYAGLFGQKIADYLPFVTLGLVVFNLISTLATDGSNVFIGSGPIILQMKAPLSLYVYQMIWRNLIIFAHNLCIFFVVIIFVNVELGWNLLWSFVGLFLVVTNSIWAGLILGGLGARYRDVPPIVASLMQVAFFLTPVFWLPGALAGREIFVQLNPFYYLIEVVRMPLLGQTPPLEIWLVVIAFNCIGAVVAVLFYARVRARIPYWL